jgi:predicted nucleic acid-binding protein
MAPKRVYWDTSCFISYLSGTHPDEIARAQVCEDVLLDARNDDIEIWTSVWTIVETVRPKTPYKAVPLPLWASLLNQTDSKGNLIQPSATTEFTKIWEYYKRSTLPSRLLSEPESLKIRGMFDWPWINKIQVIPAIAHKATEIARNHNMKTGDALHVASALARNCEVIHRWDKDYAKTDALIPSVEPARIARQGTLILPTPAP